MTWRCTRADQQDHHPGGPMWPGAAIGAHPGPWPRVPPPTSHLPPHITALLTDRLAFYWQGREVARSWGREVMTIQTSISNIVDIIRWQRGHQTAQLNVTDWTVGTGEVVGPAQWWLGMGCWLMWDKSRLRLTALTASHSEGLRKYLFTVYYIVMHYISIRYLHRI